MPQVVNSFTLETGQRVRVHTVCPVPHCGTFVGWSKAALRFHAPTRAPQAVVEGMACPVHGPVLIKCLDEVAHVEGGAAVDVQHRKPGTSTGGGASSEVHPGPPPS